MFMQKYSPILALFVLVALTVVSLTVIYISGQKNNLGANSATVVTIERGPCFGFCPIYVAKVDKDGNVQVSGSKANAEGTFKEFSISYKLNSSAVDEIFAEAAVINFFSLNDEYVDPYITDIPEMKITLTKDGVTKSVRTYGLEDTVPVFLTEFGEKVDELLQIKSRAGII